VIAGIIDSHVHFNEPGQGENWEGLETGSNALAAGGGTAFFDMPLNSLPPVTDAASFALKRAAAERSSRTDFGIWGGLVPGNVDELEPMRDAGAIGFKAFMCNSGVDEFPLSDAATLRAGMKRAAELGMLVAVHAEDDALARLRTASSTRAAPTCAPGSSRGRWSSSWRRSGRRSTSPARPAARLHIVHVSSPEGVALAREARKRGVDVTVETCPHYLLLTEEDVIRLGAPAKCFPPLRPEACAWGSGRSSRRGDRHHRLGPFAGAPGHEAGGRLLRDLGRDLRVPARVRAPPLRGARRRPAEIALRHLSALCLGQRRAPVPDRPNEGAARRGPRRRHDDRRHAGEHTLSNADLLYRHRQGPYDGASLPGQDRPDDRPGPDRFAQGRIAPGAPSGHFIRPD
jgi:allantoinase